MKQNKKVIDFLEKLTLYLPTIDLMNPAKFKAGNKLNKEAEDLLKELKNETAEEPRES